MWKLNGHLSIVKLLVRKFKILNLATLEASAAHWRLLLRLSQVRYYLINMIAGSEIRFRIKKFFFSGNTLRAVHPTSVEAERIFSVCGQFYTSVRGRLSAKSNTIEMLVFSFTKYFLLRQ